MLSPEYSQQAHTTDGNSRYTPPRSEELPALHEYVDVDALDARLDGGATDSVRVTFRYAGVTAVADAGGRISVEPSVDE